MIAENPIRLCVEEIVSCVLGNKYLKTTEKFPLSYSTVSRKIEDISCKIECGLINWIKKSGGFAVQLDESTDVAGLSVCLCS
jgi:hypothetical protein